MLKAEWTELLLRFGPSMTCGSACYDVSEGIEDCEDAEGCEGLD